MPIPTTSSSTGSGTRKPSNGTGDSSMFVTNATASKLNLSKLSDLGPVASQMTLGGPPECPTRPFCQPGLQKTYGLKFAGFKSLDAGGPATKSGLQKGLVSLGLVLSSDGSLAQK